tara:strand:+ start:49 stop:198 length:150 start_codon:yes stop_codon:yes gene_type:complete
VGFQNHILALQAPGRDELDGEECKIRYREENENENENEIVRGDFIFKTH